MTLSLITSSATMLDSNSAAYQPVFSQLNDTQFFDEGPRSIPRTSITSSMIGGHDTTAVDPYVQGVEMTRQRQYDAGLVKIWSGEQGHLVRPNGFGMDRSLFPGLAFADLDLFNPVTFIQAQALESPLWDNIFTFPIVTGDNDQLENFNFNGVIEPLTIRSVVSFFSIEAPLESHAVRANLVSGNDNQNNGTDRVLTVDYFQPNQQIVGYLDMVDIIEGHPLNGFFRFEFTSLEPFVDQRLVRNIPAISSEQDDFVEALAHMTGSTDNYVKYNQKSAACGYYYDNNGSAGTDSLAFGGMTF